MENQTPPSSPTRDRETNNNSTPAADGANNTSTDANNTDNNANNNNNANTSPSATTSTSNELIVTPNRENSRDSLMEELPYEIHEFDAYCWQKNGANKSLKNGVLRQHFRCSQYAKGKGECKARTHIDTLPDGTQIVGRSLFPHNHHPPSSLALKYNHEARERPRSIYPESEMSPSLVRRLSEENSNNNNNNNNNSNSNSSSNTTEPTHSQPYFPRPPPPRPSSPTAPSPVPSPAHMHTPTHSRTPSAYSTPYTSPTASSSSSTSFISAFSASSNLACNLDPYKISDLHNKSAFMLDYGIIPYFSLIMAPAKSLDFLASHGGIICVDGPVNIMREGGRSQGEREVDYQLITLLANVDGSFIPLAFYITNAKKKQEAYEKFFTTLRTTCNRFNPTIIFTAADPTLIMACKTIFPNSQIAAGDQCLEGWRKRLRRQYTLPVPLERLGTVVQVLLDEWGYHQELISCDVFFLPLPRKNNRFFPPDNPTPPAHPRSPPSSPR